MHHAQYERTALDLARPGAIFAGFRGTQQAASISSRPPVPEAFVERFTLACRTLAVLEVDWAALLTGDEFALAVTAPADHPAELDLFVVALTVGPAGASPTGTITPYRLDRDTGAITWGSPRPARASCSQGMWAQALGPLCLDRAAASAGELAALLDRNRRVDNDVLLL
jgi:hypothetical protein